MYKDILVPIDLNHTASQGKAVRTACELARAFGARLHVVTVVPGFGLPVVASHFPEDFEEKALAGAARDLEDFVAQSFPQDLEIRQSVAHGTVFDEILRCAEALGAGLIVMSSHRPEMQDYLIGTNASTVVRHANCSVLVVRDEQTGQLGEEPR